MARLELAILPLNSQLTKLKVKILTKLSNLNRSSMIKNIDQYYGKIRINNLAIKCLIKQRCYRQVLYYLGLTKLLIRTCKKNALTSMAPQLLENIDEYQSKIRINIFFSPTRQLNYPTTWKYSLFQYWLPYSVLTHLPVLERMLPICIKKRFVLRETRNVSLAKRKFKYNNNKRVNKKSVLPPLK